MQKNHVSAMFSCYLGVAVWLGFWHDYLLHSWISNSFNQGLI